MLCRVFLNTIRFPYKGKFLSDFRKETRHSLNNRFYAKRSRGRLLWIIFDVEFEISWHPTAQIILHKENRHTDAMSSTATSWLMYI